jgi:ABC-type dipeptide/oligopeptide/nickel transport system permease subunit
MIELLFGVILGLLASYFLSRKEQTSRYVLLAIIAIWFYIIITTYFPRLTTLIMLYFNNLGA